MSASKRAEIVGLLTQTLPLEDLQWIASTLAGHLASPNRDYVWPRVGTIPPDLLRELDTRGAQAREAVEQ